MLFITHATLISCLNRFLADRKDKLNKNLYVTSFKVYANASRVNCCGKFHKNKVARSMKKFCFKREFCRDESPRQLCVIFHLAHAVYYVRDERVDFYSLWH